MRALRRLRDDQRGQIHILFLLGVVTLVMLVMMLLNTGQHVTERIEVQNAADSLALSRASWAARSLNIMAMNQVAMTQSAAVAVSATALAPVATKALMDAPRGARRARQGFQACGAIPEPISQTICRVAIGIQIAALVAASVDAAYILAGPLQVGRNGPVGLATDYAEYAEAFVAMNDHIAETYPEFSGRITDRLAQENRVAAPVFYPHEESDDGSPSSPLPVERVPTPVPGGGIAPQDWIDTAAFCQVWRTGRIVPGVPYPTAGNYPGQGFDVPSGPLHAAWENTEDRIFQIWAFYTTIQVGYYPWLMQYDRRGNWWRPIKTKTRGEKTQQPEGLDPSGGNGATDPGSGSGQQAQTQDENRFANFMSIAWPAVCASRLVPRISYTNVLPVELTLYRVKERPLLPLAGILPPQATRDALSFVAFARRTKHDGQARIQGEHFKVATPSTFAYAQAEVYNHVSTLSNGLPSLNFLGETPANYDLYTQGWRARLTPAWLLQRDKDGALPGDYAPVADALDSDPEYASVADWLEALSPEGLEQINVH